MKESTRNSSCAASPFGLALELTASLLPLWKAIAELVQQFLAVRPSPESTHQFENTLHDLLRKIGLLIMAWVFNHIEPETKEESPARIMFEREEYRRKPKSPNHEVGTLFGEFRLDRLLYEPLESGLRSIFPLEIELGVVARNATPAFAERVAELATDSTQGELLSILKRQHGVH